MTTFGFENPGEVRHKMILVLLRPDVTEARITEPLQGGITSRKVREQFGEGDILGILLASPHESSAGKLLVHLVHGRTYPDPLPARGATGGTPAQSARHVHDLQSRIVCEWD